MYTYVHVYMSRCTHTYYAYTCIHVRTHTGVQMHMGQVQTISVGVNLFLGVIQSTLLMLACRRPACRVHAMRPFGSVRCHSAQATRARREVRARRARVLPAVWEDFATGWNHLAAIAASCSLLTSWRQAYARATYTSPCLRAVSCADNSKTSGPDLKPHAVFFK